MKRSLPSTLVREFCDFIYPHLKVKYRLVAEPFMQLEDDLLAVDALPLLLPFLEEPIVCDKGLFELPDSVWAKWEDICSTPLDMQVAGSLYGFITRGRQFQSEQ